MQTFEQRIAGVPIDAARLERELRELPPASMSYLIFFVPRSGSSWLTELIVSTGQLGDPQEWFNPSSVEAIADMMNVNRPQEYLEILRRRMVSPPGVFGGEVTCMQYDLLGSLDPIEMLGERTKYFYLRRRDLVKQAISLYKAVTSDVFHDTGTLTASHLARIDAVPYDLEGLMYWMRHLLAHELGCERLFRERGLTPLRVYYEDIVLDPRATAELFVREVCGAPVPPERKLQSSHRPIATAKNREFEERFRREGEPFIAETLAMRPGCP